MIHKFEVGQAVVPASPVRPSRNTYLVVMQLPLTSYEPQYLVQGVRSGLDCVVCESQIDAADDHQPSLSIAAMGGRGARLQSGRHS